MAGISSVSSSSAPSAPTSIRIEQIKMDQERRTQSKLKKAEVKELAKAVEPTRPRRVDVLA